MLVNHGAWQASPDGGGDILLSESAFIDIFEDRPPFRADDDLSKRVEQLTHTHTFAIGKRGGIYREVY